MQPQRLCVASSQVLIFVRMFPAKAQRRKGAKREKNSLNIIFAPLRLCGKCLVVAVLLCESRGFRLNLHNRRDAEDAEVAQRLETEQR